MSPRVPLRLDDEPYEIIKPETPDNHRTNYHTADFSKLRLKGKMKRGKKKRGKK